MKKKIEVILTLIIICCSAMITCLEFNRREPYLWCVDDISTDERYEEYDFAWCVSEVYNTEIEGSGKCYIITVITDTAVGVTFDYWYCFIEYTGKRKRISKNQITLIDCDCYKTEVIEQ